MKKLRSQNGFTILELIIVMVIMATLWATIAPKLQEGISRQRLGVEIAKNATMLIDANKQYYYDHPAIGYADLPTLQAQGYINAAWSPTHAFHGAYSLTPAGVGKNATISITNLPSDIQNIVRMSVPGWSYSGTTGTSVIPPPGQEASLDMLVHRSGVLSDGTTPSTMWGDLQMKPLASQITQPNVRVNDGTNDRLTVGKPSASSDYGVHALNGTGDLYLHGDTSRSSGQVIARGNGFAVQDATGTTNYATVDRNGNLASDDATLRQLSNASLSQNNIWTLYLGLNHDGDIVTVQPLSGIDPSKVQYKIFVSLSYVEGMEPWDSVVYPVYSLRTWADPLSQTSWQVHVRAEDNHASNPHTAQNQMLTVHVVAVISNT